MALQEIDLLLLPGLHLQEGGGEVFLRRVRRLLPLAGGLEEDRWRSLDSLGRGGRTIQQRIDESDVDLVARRLVLLQQILSLRPLVREHPSGRIKGRDLYLF